MVNYQPLLDSTNAKLKEDLKNGDTIPVLTHVSYDGRDSKFSFNLTDDDNTINVIVTLTKDQIIKWLFTGNNFVPKIRMVLYKTKNEAFLTSNLEKIKCLYTKK